MWSADSTTSLNHGHALLEHTGLRHRRGRNPRVLTCIIFLLHFMIKRIVQPFVLLALVFLCGVSIEAQTLSGRVLSRDSKSTPPTPLPGASVRWLGTSVGTVSQKDGRFSIARSSSSTLVVSFVGYKSDTTQVQANQSSVEIVLTPTLSLNEIHVEAATQTVSSASIKTETISKHQLERSACCSLAESFEKSPSVEVAFSDAATGAKQIQLLGLRGLYTSTTTDVVPMLRGLATPFGLDYVPGSFIEGISISKGAGSVLNGYEGITGQINIEYKKPTEDVPFFANAYINSSQRAELNLTSSQELSDTWHSMIMAHGGWMQHETDANNDGFSDMPKYKNLNVIGRVQHVSEGGTEFQFLAKAILDDIESGTLEHSMQDQTDHAFQVSTKSNRFEFISKYGLNPLVESPEIKAGLQVAGSYHDTHTLIGTREYTGKETMLYSKLIFSMTISPSFNLAYGLSCLVDRYDETFDPVTPRDTVFSFIRNEFVPGVFAEATINATEQISIVAGLRADAHNIFGSFVTPRVHVKYNPFDEWSMRASAGSGMRVANALSDNISSLVNQRDVIIQPGLLPERAWNYGASINGTLHFFNCDWVLDGELYRTDFKQQVVVDMDQSAQRVVISNLNGQSASTSAMVQIQTSPIERLDVSGAYRYIDSRTTTGGVYQDRPLISPHRALFTAGYQDASKAWQFDLTVVWNSGGRIPSTATNPDTLRMADRYSDFTRANFQITRRFHGVDIYAGVENITNFLQQQAVISPLDPHSQYFDASLVWGPLDTRFAYLGIRWRIDAGAH